VVQRVGDTRLKIYLYHIPPVAMVGITPKLVERLLKAYPSAIAGMKDSSGDWNNTKTFLDAFAETARPVGDSPRRARTARSARTASPARTFDVFVGSESFLLDNMRNGGAGTISATANVNPAAIYKLYEKGSGVCDKRRGNKKALTAASASTMPELEHLQARLSGVREVFSSTKFPSMIAALKQAIAIYRNDPEWTRVRPPLVELTTDQVKLLAANLKAIGFAMPV
jgi:4-hydroxy-tetrahydrodipicolinate synthase